MLLSAKTRKTTYRGDLSMLPPDGRRINEAVIDHITMTLRGREDLDTLYCICSQWAHVIDYHVEKDKMEREYSFTDSKEFKVMNRMVNQIFDFLLYRGDPPQRASRWYNTLFNKDNR